MTWRKLKNHIRYRLTRAKTYLGTLLAALAMAIPYLSGTDWLEPASKAMAACAFLLAIVGGGKDAAGSDTK